MGSLGLFEGVFVPFIFRDPGARKMNRNLHSTIITVSIHAPACGLQLPKK